MARRHLLDLVTYLMPGYVINWHHKVIADALEAVERGEIKRLMIEVPPRHGKSLLSSTYFPAWYMGKHPDHEIALASYSADLAVDFGRNTRNIMRSEEYAHLFETHLAEDSKSAGRWNTEKGGGYSAVGIGGALTGRGANLAIIDDPIKNREEADSQTYQQRVIEWFRSTLYTRLAPAGAIVLINTRWSELDLSGQLLAEEKNDGDVWTRINLPAIAIEDEEQRKAGEALWADRYPVVELERIKRNVGTREWLALYQQSPVDNLTSEFRPDWFKETDLATAKSKKTGRYLTIDTALSESDSADYTGWVDNIVEGDGTWNLACKRLRINSAELINLLFLMYEEHHYNAIGIEDGIYSKAIEPFLKEEQNKRNVFLPIKKLKHGGRAKVLRIRGLIPRYEAGRIKHIKGECIDLEAELLRFPTAAHDDVADAAAYQDQLINPMSNTNADDEMLRAMIVAKQAKSMVR